jgi:hypothetical protein
MWIRRLTTCLVASAVVVLSASCATTKSVGDNIQHAYNHEPIDKQGLTQALSSDTKDMEANLVVLRHKIEAAYALLKTNVQKRWGQNDTKVANRTVFVKYTQGYKSRVITDFDHGTLTVETVDETDPQSSLKATIAAALLTTSDPATVDLFTDKDVTLESNRRPYLYGLIHDQHGKSIQTREQAKDFANYLVPQKMQTRCGWPLPNRPAACEIPQAATLRLRCQQRREIPNQYRYHRKLPLQKFRARDCR